MSAFVRFRPLSGAKDEEPLCYLLELDDAKILLDCGWAHPFNTDASTIRFLQTGNLAKQIDAVLFSHADLEHLGGYPYAVANLGLTCPSYSTFPLYDLGQACLLDAIKTRRFQDDFTLFNAQDVQTAFEKTIQLRYSQPLSLSGKLKGVTITAYGAGHSLGGTIWKIKKGTDEIVYAVDYNHGRERHLNGCVLLGEALSRPTLLITDSYNSLITQLSRKKRDELLLETVSSTLLSSSNVLIPTDSMSRSLELSYLLETLWNTNRDLSRFGLFLLGYKSDAVISIAKRFLEWMEERIASSISQERSLPFDLRHVKLVNSLNDIEKYSGPKVVIASPGDLESGLAREVLFSWSANPNNMVVLPERGRPHSLTRKLYTEWSNSSKDETSPKNLNLDFEFEEKRCMLLQGDELSQYLLDEALKKEELEKAEDLNNQIIPDDDDSDLSDGEDDEVAAKKGQSNLFDIYVKDTVRIGGFFKINQSFRMFPVIDYRKRVDDYGEVVDPQSFLNADSRLAAAHAAKTDELPPVQLDVQKEEDKEPPHKFIVAAMQLQIRCKVIFIDFEGRSDGKSIKNILSYDKFLPRKLILIHGSEEATNDLELFCMNDSKITNEVLCPNVNESINVSSAANIYQIKLTDSLVTSLSTSKFQDWELAYVSGVIRIQEEPPADTADEIPERSTEIEAKPTAIPLLDSIVVEHRRFHKPVIVGDLKLSEFRRLLLEKGFRAEFDAGVLIVNGSILIRRQAHGRIVLEGGLNRDYYKIRHLLYREHAIL